MPISDMGFLQLGHYFLMLIHMIRCRRNLVDTLSVWSTPGGVSDD